MVLPLVFVTSKRQQLSRAGERGDVQHERRRRSQLLQAAPYGLSRVPQGNVCLRVSLLPGNRVCGGGEEGGRHCREAIGPLLKLLEARDRIPPGVFHCFEGGPAEAERGLALGFHISFAGNVTYKNAQRLQQAAAVVPLNRLLLETDSPYLPPHPHRGERNEPAYTALTRDFLAELLGIPPLEIDEAATVNTRRLFSLRG